MRKIINAFKISIKETDKLLLLLCAAVSAYGIVMVWSATKSAAGDALLSRDARTMLIAVVLGMIMAIVISFIDSEFIIRLWPLIAFVCLALMVLTLAIGVGPDERPDARTWLRLGSASAPFFFQSSELLKVGFVITFGMHLDLVKDKLNTLKNILFLCLHALVPIALVIVTGDLGSALIFMIIFAGMMFLGGLSLKYLGGGILAIIAASPLVWKFALKNLQKERFLALLYPEQYPAVIYQQEKGMIAIGSGGLFGQGLFQGDYTQAGIVPMRENDMIFSVIGEELGFVGAAAALLLLAFIVLKIIRTGKQSKDHATALMCYGVAAMIAGHVVVNVGMCLMLLPVVGITLPFFSAGGSSNLCLYIGIGLVLSIYRYNQSRDAVNFHLRTIRTPFLDD
ncbi:MAG: FtsW/RodA/SpoVE family cell cycle protein [Oscillospiraceae bacterium]|jgi:rod shape determining protein RodA|nr:FtsW/RodA/SpoVE family cell cycle protein [Oscillospiraceae bacterium]